jgi:hypothetical protein
VVNHTNRVAPSPVKSWIQLCFNPFVVVVVCSPWKKSSSSKWISTLLRVISSRSGTRQGSCNRKRPPLLRKVAIVVHTTCLYDPIGLLVCSGALEDLKVHAGLVLQSRSDRRVLRCRFRLCHSEAIHIRSLPLLTAWNRWWTRQVSIHVKCWLAE